MKLWNFFGISFEKNIFSIGKITFTVGVDMQMPR